MALYYHFTVLGAKCRVTFYQKTDNSQKVLCYVGLKDSSAFQMATNFTTVTEQAKVKWRMLGDKGAANSSVAITKTFSPTKFFGITKSNMNESQYEGTTSGDPVEGAYFEVGTVNVDESSSTQPLVRAIIQIDYFAKFHGPRAIGSS